MRDEYDLAVVTTVGMAASIIMVVVIKDTRQTAHCTTPIAID